jgi:hypothetical protein
VVPLQEQQAAVPDSLRLAAEVVEVRQSTGLAGLVDRRPILGPDRQVQVRLVPLTEQAVEEAEAVIFQVVRPGPELMVSFRLILFNKE